MAPTLFKKALAEFIGILMFVYVGTGAAISTGEQLASSAAPSSASVARVLPIAFAFGMSILVQAYSFGHISGGHFNPAVTFSLFLVGECEAVQMLAYFLAQFSGATVASLILWSSVSALGDGRGELQAEVIGSPPFGLGANGLNPALNSGNGFILEFMGTLVLCVTVLMTCLHTKGLAKGTPNMAPVAIGFAVFLSHLVLIPLTGCGINPARTFGPGIVNKFAGESVFGASHWIYYFGPFAGATVASLIFTILMKPDPDEEEPVTTEKCPEQAPDLSTRNHDDDLASNLRNRMNKNLAGLWGDNASTESRAATDIEAVADSDGSH